MQTIKSINPSTEKVIQEIKTSSVQEVKSIVALARRASDSWGIDLQKRLVCLRNFQKLVKKEEVKIAALIHREEGKPIREAGDEILDVLGVLDFYIKNSQAILNEEKIDSNNIIRYEPIGVVGIISPWNYPLSTPIWSIVPALTAGNTIVFKPSEETPLVGLMIKKLVDKAKFPKGVFNIVIGDHRQGKAVVQSEVDMVAFTGSVEAGKNIMRASADYLHKVAFELGGKDPMIVCADAPLERTTNGAIWGAFTNSGECCTSVERVYVMKSIADKFINLAVNKTKELKLVDEIPPMINRKQLMKVEQHIKDAKTKGARILCGGMRVKGKGFFFEPTVLVNVNHKMKIMTEETFGAVLPIMQVKDEKEAIHLANDSDYGLGASVWSRNINKSKKIADQLKSGIVWINDVNIPYPNYPWGGCKMSGFGKVLSKYGILEFTHIKHINIASDSKDKREWWYPY